MAGGGVGDRSPVLQYFQNETIKEMRPGKEMRSGPGDTALTVLHARISDITGDHKINYKVFYTV